MGGIAGFSALGPASAAPSDPARLHAMCDAIRHRGPDGARYWIDCQASLGVRELLAGDESTGESLYADEHGTIAVVVDGDILNRKELGAELMARGLQLRTGGSAELMAAAYQAWGRDMFVRVRGPFGVALWDGSTATFLLGRDRSGVKPLYYGVAGGRLFFGSEAKCLLQNADIDRAVDAAALDHYLAYLVTPRDASIFRGIKKLRPGHFLTSHHGNISIEPYWRLSPDPATDTDDTTAVSQLERTLSDTLETQTQGSRSCGVLLSGGVTSSLLAAAMAKTSSARVRTFSIAFGNDDADEVARARSIAGHLGTEHYELPVQPDASRVLDRVAWHLDEPFGDPSALAAWYIADAVRGHAPVILSGDGADEIFGGCERYVPSPRVALFDRVTGPVGRTFAGLAGRVMPPNMHGRDFLKHVARDLPGRYVDAMTFCQRDERRQLLSPDVWRLLGDSHTEARFAQPFDRFSNAPWTSQMMSFDFETDLPEDVLTKIDRASMAHSLDWRVPFVDADIVELASRVPLSTKIRNGQLKFLLKELAARHIPRDILSGPKRGFGFAITRWFPTSVNNVFADVLSSPAARQRGYFNYAHVERILDEHLRGLRDHSMRLWQLMMFELWHRQHADAPALAA